MEKHQTCFEQTDWNRVFMYGRQKMRRAGRAQTMKKLYFYP